MSQLYRIFISVSYHLLVQFCMLPTRVVKSNLKRVPSILNQNVTKQSIYKIQEFSINVKIQG